MEPRDAIATQQVPGQSTCIHMRLLLVLLLLLLVALFDGLNCKICDSPTINSSKQEP